MARVKDPMAVKDDLQNLLGGLAKELNRLIYAEGGISWGTKFAASLGRGRTKSGFTLGGLGAGIYL